MITRRKSSEQFDQPQKKVKLEGDGPNLKQYIQNKQTRIILR